MKVEVKELGEIKIVKLTGQIRISTQDEFKEVLDKLIEENSDKKTILSLDGVVYMNSAGLGMIIDTYKKFKSNNKELMLCNLMPEIRKLFEVTRVNRFIKIFANESEALKQVSTNN